MCMCNAYLNKNLFRGKQDIIIFNLYLINMINEILLFLKLLLFTFARALEHVGE